MNKFVFYPFLLSLFPILSLFAYNIDQVNFSSVIIPMIISFVVTVFLFFGLKFFTKNDAKSGIVVSIFIILFFSYGHIIDTIKDLSIGTITISKDSILLLSWLCLFSACSYLVITTSKNLKNFTPCFNIVSILLIIMPILEIGNYEIRTRNFSVSVNNTVYEKNANYYSNNTEITPDIYYIILDGYAREDILKEIYKYDNSGFVNWLEEKGFYVASGSTSNYPATFFSLASSLNFEYINYLTDIVGVESQNRQPLADLIKNNKTSNFLKERGYLFVSFSSGWPGTEYIKDNADLYISPNEINLTEFENVLISTTVLDFFVRENLQYRMHRNRILYTFDHLPDVAEIDAPTFTFAHIWSPHPPFVFDRNGKEIRPNEKFSPADIEWKLLNKHTSQEYTKLYSEQLDFINKKIKITIDKILSQSKTPPIIIIQGDHGPAAVFDDTNLSDLGIKERLSILNAYYFPNKKIDAIYKDITPVNTFRLIFNQYFNTDYDLLEDNNYCSTQWQPYNLDDVTDKMR